ncbi:MAG: DNA primase, partial [Acidobacteriota bacterium]
MEIKDQIKRSVSITDVVQSYGLDLKPAGKNYKALCPFHTEKTPSFFVKPESDSFACYGCNKFGDIFTFVQNIENVGFVEAMNLLIERFNIPVEKKKGFNYSKEKKYSLINETALKYFSDNLSGAGEGQRAMKYLKDRSISQETIKDFSLGYSLNKWDGLLTFLKNESLDLDMCVELGLLVRNNKGELYDRFRGRIIFPIFSESGNSIGFGGRTISDDKVKYLNSPETPLFNKGKNLYGFSMTRQYMREKKYSILVEGYFDVISLYQHGIKNVSASLGTALTPGQIHLLRRASDEIFIGYDSDNAGVEATVRGIERMFEQNLNPRIISFRGEKDPDDFIRKHGRE